MTENTLNISFTDRAIDRMKDLLPDGGVLRLDIKATGCSGNSYEMAKTLTPEAGDDIIVVAPGVSLAVPKTKSWMLIGTKIDYEESDFASEFVFINPNEKGRCGCGESFVL